MSSEAPERVWLVWHDWWHVGERWYEGQVLPNDPTGAEYRLASAVDALLAERDAEIEAQELKVEHLSHQLRIVSNELATERQRARLPEDLVERIRTFASSSTYDMPQHIWAETVLFRDILAAVDSKSHE